MNFKIFFNIFLCVFLAELGDKTQFATMLFSCDRANNKYFVFLASVCALALSSAIAVLMGNFISKFVSEKTLTILSGILFIIIGVWTLIK